MDSNISEKNEKNLRILHEKPKNPRFLGFSHHFKQFLKWLKLRNAHGELLIDDSTYMPKLYAEWNKQIVLWFFNLMMSGFIFQLATLHFFNPGLKGFLIYCFIWGMFLFVVKRTFNGLIMGLCRVGNSFSTKR